MRYFIFFLFATFILACESQTSEVAGEEMAESPNIEIQAEGLTVGKSYLVGIFTGQQYTVDSAEIDMTGKITFSREEPYPAGFYIAWFPNNQTIQMLIDKDQTFSLKTKANDIDKSMVVEGSVDNELLYKNLNFQTVQQPQFNSIAEQLKSHSEGSAEYNALKAQEKQLVENRKTHLQEIFTQHPNSFFTIFKKAGQSPKVRDVRKPDGTVDNALQVYLYRSEFWNDVDFSDNRLLYTPVISNKLNRHFNELTPQNQDSIIN